MIFLSVGTQLPFDRLTRLVADWCVANPDLEIFGQVGATSIPELPFAAKPSLSGAEFSERFARAKIIISHAGMGNIITALELGKPIVVVPRLATRGEHRNDHQLHTAERFMDYVGVYVVRDDAEFFAQVARALRAGARASSHCADRDRLLQSVRCFIDS